ncbi:hypothetical protein HRR83_009156 [Exophiala dermatitidis]|uniref:Uncharacterized protein n=2 Tax=Exophiala dermatitidis TaxID=5970 RepID=H6C7W9_EXODN|nr:uncharacterized protein HMPREF1120_08166 [Exophiala dermatitidis NIH/UT8656]KAJ4502814.1 hypothetical protein HRR75_008279 [Exophiala dermatitidis]EHY60196.1 hypothetical protein HMPREF1120_08166 [Exophiala dermatitidis NIH/UT8656]KAJ4504367.1 hypothetical protein HRR74_009013 [Exophiala dermatitidis]KAJ4504863.1 hypothetical protein HRR73_008617 [Exophiala dermatitidis]KAJ4530755.1 hypothetical protein HRR76_008452 [Exophiala dermatitidis]
MAMTSNNRSQNQNQNQNQSQSQSQQSQVCLLDSDRLSSLLRDALSWSLSTNDANGGDDSNNNKHSVSSLMVSAMNGSILAYAYRDGQTPSVKDMRTQSTTMTAAYSTVASEDADVLVFEAQNTGAVSVITPIADHVLLAVTGPAPKSKSKSKRRYDHNGVERNGVGFGGQDRDQENGNDIINHNGALNGTLNGVHGSARDHRHHEVEGREEEEGDETETEGEEHYNGDGLEDEDEDERHRQIRLDLELVSQELAGLLRAELARMKWPNDI